MRPLPPAPPLFIAALRPPMSGREAERWLERTGSRDEPGSGELTRHESGDAVHDALHGQIDEVIAEWKRMVAAEPWAPATPARLVNALPEMLPRMLRLMMRGATQMDRELAEFIAREHGYFRREDGVPLAALAEEWNHLRRACWKVLRRSGVEEAASLAALHRLDSLIDDAIGFSLRGYYAPELDALRGRGLERRAEAGDRRRSSGDRRSRGDEG